MLAPFRETESDVHAGGDFEAAYRRERDLVNDGSDDDEDDEDVEAEREAAGEIMLLVRATSHDPFLNAPAGGTSRAGVGRRASSYAGAPSATGGGANLGANGR